MPQLQIYVLLLIFLEIKLQVVEIQAVKQLSDCSLGHRYNERMIGSTGVYAPAIL